MNKLGNWLIPSQESILSLN